MVNGRTRTATEIEDAPAKAAIVVCCGGLLIAAGSNSRYQEPKSK